MSVQTRNGVVDIAVADEAEAVRAAQQYLSYFQGATPRLDGCADQRLLRRAVPENRLRVYDVRSVLTTLADTDSVLELRRDFGVGMITALIRVEGRPVGVVANNPMHLGGAIDSDGADKAARFMQLCDAYDIPLLFLCDTPGNMVGPEAEKTALVRHCCRLYVIGANVTVPFFTVVLRKAYGLGAQAMARRRLPRAVLRGVLADRRVRRHGARGRGQARLPQRAGGHRRPRRAQADVRREGRGDVRAGQGAQRRRAVRDRRRDRPRRHAPVDHGRPPLGPAARALDAGRSTRGSTPGDHPVVRRALLSTRSTPTSRSEPAQSRAPRYPARPAGAPPRGSWRRGWRVCGRQASGRGGLRSPRAPRHRGRPVARAR